MESECRILIVEGSKTQALQLRLLLEHEGWVVSVCETAELALVELGQSTPDLVVVDQVLPGMSGDDLCRRIRMNLQTRGVSIMMLTAGESAGTEMQGLESGADDYLPKSENPEILLLRIRALLRKSPAPSSILNSHPADFQPTRLLAIDDSTTDLEFLAGELRMQGYEVEKATTGPEALRLLASRSFDCVLVDLITPGMDSIEVCRRITKMHALLTHPPAVIMLTSSETKEDMARGLEAGADDFVVKSSDVSVLRARIEALLRRRFFQEENHRIVAELKIKDLETSRARAAHEAAEARAVLAEQLALANRGLASANQKLRDTQSQLIHTEKMSSLGQLVAGIAHEINNPLAFVLSHLFIVESGLNQIGPEAEPHLSEPGRRRLKKIRARVAEMQEGLDRVKTLVLNLRTFSRLDEGDFKTVDVADSIDSVLLLLKYRSNGHIRVEKHYGPERGLYCCGGRINQVLMNLIANAMDAMSGEGKIIVTTGEDEMPGRFRISVRDTGSGIPEGHRSRLFDPFFTTKPVGQGTGLGLAIAYGIVQDHEGSIEVESQEGVGSEFTVRIPMDLQSRRHE
jgi:two-component system, NtrC family, sensor kinase